MKALLSICLFWGLLSPGATLNCYHCTGDDCAGPEIRECEVHEDACFISVTETTLVNSLMPKYNLISKRCAPAHLCLQNYISLSTLARGNFRSAVQYCYTDLCNDMPLSLPKIENPSTNEVQCPACFALNSTECLEEKAINCTGGETNCIDIAGDLDIESPHLARQVQYHPTNNATC